MLYSTFSRSCKIIQKRLSSIKTQIRQLEGTIPLPDFEKSIVKQLLKESNEKYKEFNVKVEKLTATDPPPLDIDEDGVDEFYETISNLFVDICSYVESQWPDLNSTSSSLNSSQVSQQTTNGSSSNAIRLPKITLPTFNGDYHQWVSFYNLFQVTVHENNNLSNVEKFQYLLAQLDGEALNEIKSIPLTNENYNNAWNKLVTRYNNVRLLISLHINKILDLPSSNCSSIKSLRTFVSSFKEQTQALLALGTDVVTDNPILLTLLLRKFDSDTRKRFESSRTESSTTMPFVSDFLKFLEEECAKMEAANLVSNQPCDQITHVEGNKSSFVRHANLSSNPLNKYFSKQKENILVASSKQKEPYKRYLCLFCKASNHNIYTCVNFKQTLEKERYNFVKSNNLCVNCLRQSHSTSECTSSVLCSKCGKKHHTLLHFSSSTSNEKIENAHYQSCSNVNESTSLTSVCVSQQTNQTILLGTTLVHVTSTSGKTAVLRALLDSAAQATFITQNAAQLLDLKRTYLSNSNVCGLSSTKVSIRGKTTLNISTLNLETSFTSHPVIILNKITSNLPGSVISPVIREKMKNFKLADPGFDRSSSIDMLLGADIFAQCIGGETLKFGDDLPVALNTCFGFVLIGNSPTFDESSDVITLLSTNDIELHESLQRFWRLEDLPCQKQVSKDDEDCEKHFTETFSRDTTGRYIVKLPFKDSPESLGDSYGIANKRFNCLERRLSSNCKLQEKYTAFMAEYSTLGHMKESKINTHLGTHCYLPHHGVMKDEKLRVVFDASCATSNSVSINQLLHTGPKLHNEITDILYSFRRFPVVFTCDIRQMFRQILVHPEDQKYQLILWRENPSEALKTYQLTTITYGMSCSPFLANRTIKQLLIDEGSHHKSATKALQNQIFVDDAILGADSLEDALLLKEDVINLMSKGRFELRKWSSNNKTFLDTIPEGYKNYPTLKSFDQPMYSVLGVKWLPDIDSFTYSIRLPCQNSPTKRFVLSCVSKIFDPSGWLAPVTFSAKCLIQELWTLGLGWDDPISGNVLNKWNDFCNQLVNLESIHIPRYSHLSCNSDIQLLGFCDASLKGYAAVVYLRTVDSQGLVHISLIASKTRVAPLQRVSLPRLELCGAFLLSKLLHHYYNLFLSTYSNVSIFAWCDSTVTLSWIHSPSYRLKIFVGNRVSQIQELVPPHSWFHINSSDNPADCASRGLSSSELKTHPLWWTGPEWITKPPGQWPSSECSLLPMEEMPERLINKCEVLHSLRDSRLEFLERFSSWVTLQRTLAFVLRFVYNSKNKDKITGTLSLGELSRSKTKILLLVQSVYFSEDIKKLKNNQTCNTSIQRLMPFLDSEGLLRVGGRLRKSDLPEATKYPIILPKTCHITNLLIDEFHVRLLHAGPQFLQSVIAKEYWILSARSIIRSRIYKCVKCFKCKPRFFNPVMSDLPANRILPSRPFTVCGTDYAGPFLIKIHKLKRTQPVKVYWCLFICFTAKAVHIEVVTDLTSDAYLAALLRFTSRRGLPKDIYSDCGTNYVGAASQLRKVMNDFLNNDSTKRKLLHFSQQNSIQFHFSPANAPHFGGLWERAVQSAKFHLNRVVGDQMLTMEEFMTISIRIEAMLNSRPLTPLSNDPSEIEVLTPGHFLIGAPFTSPPEQKLEGPLNHLKRWRMVQAMHQQIWKCWKRDYLHHLQLRSKWAKASPVVKAGDMVLIKDDNTAPLNWTLGRIEKCLPGDDGIIRVVQLKTKSGRLIRPVVKIAPIPTELS